MSYEVVLRPTQSRAKVRNPWGVLGLSIITLGIYVPFWWYFINREMRDLGRAREVRDLGDSPGLSVLALTLGAILIIPPFWTLVTTCQRIYRADRHMGRDDPLNGWIAFLLFCCRLASSSTYTCSSNSTRLGNPTRWRRSKGLGLRSNSLSQHTPT